MNTPRPYTPSDWPALTQLLRDGRQANNGTYYVHHGDVSWWLHYSSNPDPFAGNVFVWQTADAPQAWVIFTPDDGFYDLFVHPSLRGTAQEIEMHQWCIETLTAKVTALGGTTLRAMWISERDTVRQQILASLGFRLADETEHQAKLLYSTLALDNLPALELPDGFTARGCLGESEIENRARAQHGAFQSKLDMETYIARFRRFMRSPVYVPDNDRVIVAQDGRIAAFAINWHDPLNGIGLFEPVGTHPEFQRHGLGRAVLYSSFHHMRESGLNYAMVCIEADNPRNVAFYQACGFEIQYALTLYVKPTTDGGR